jgi:hypothetical protein
VAENVGRSISRVDPLRRPNEDGLSIDRDRVTEEITCLAVFG